MFRMVVLVLTLVSACGTRDPKQGPEPTVKPVAGRTVPTVAPRTPPSMPRGPVDVVAAGELAARASDDALPVEERQRALADLVAEDGPGTFELLVQLYLSPAGE